MNCPQCGAEVAATDTFCGSCGKPRSPDARRAERRPAAAGAARRRPPMTPPRRDAPTTRDRPHRRPRRRGAAAAHAAPDGPARGRLPGHALPGPVTGAPIAEWWQRAVALIIDWVISASPVHHRPRPPTAAVTTTTTDRSAAAPDDHSAVSTSSMLLFILVYLAYYMYFNGGERGQTLGKMALGIATRDESGQGHRLRPGGRSVRRSSSCSASSACIPLIIDYLSPLWDPRRQAWHDKTATRSSSRSSSAPRRSPWDVGAEA